MQNVQNAAEIQQRVINLVELYRTKVGKESQIAKDAKADDEFWLEESIGMMEEEGLIGVGLYGEGPHTEVWIKYLMVNEQLLGHFYSVVAGENAEKDILEQLLPEVYDKTIFTEDEESFLMAHFKEMVNYIILTPCDDSLEWVHRHDGKDTYTIPEEVLELFASRLSLSHGAVVYNPFTGFAQFTTLYHGRKFYCEESYEVFNRKWNAFCGAANIHKKVDNLGLMEAWMKVALYANNVNVEIIEDGSIPVGYDAVLAYIPSIPKIEENDAFSKLSKMDGLSIASKITASYHNLKEGGIMGLLIPCTQLYDNEKRSSQFKALLDLLVTERALLEIIQLPAVMSHHEDVCLFIARKGSNSNTMTFIDARFATKESTKKNNRNVLNLDDFKKMLQNQGYESKTGLRKMVEIPSKDLSLDILIPQVYTIERPSEEERPVPFSRLCTLESIKICDVQFDLPEDTPWITKSDFTPLYTGNLDISAVRKADCPNNPPFVKGSNEYGFDKDGKFVDSIWSQIRKSKGRHVLDYRSCTYVDGNKDTVLYKRSTESGIQVAVVRALGKPYAVSSGIHVFCPKDDYDVNSLAALLRQPIVYRQLIAYEQFGIGVHLDDILVPTDKRVIGDELYRMKKEESVTNELEEKVEAMKTEYINEVRMRKHDMGQKVFDLINTEDLMRYYVENRETESDLWPQIEEQLNHLRSTIHELSEMLDHLSQEEKFGTPEMFDLNEYLADLQHSNNVNGFTLSYHLDRKSILDLQLSRMKDKDIKDIGSLKATPTVYMAKNDLQRVISNILTNAQKHGFLDSNRKDYEVNIRLEFNVEKGMYQIEFRNNGKPLPEGLNKMRYGIKGEKAGQTAGTGLGGSVVKSIVEHYKGDYDVFTDGKWTVVRIYLPIAI